MKYSIRAAISGFLLAAVMLLAVTGFPQESEIIQNQVNMFLSIIENRTERIEQDKKDVEAYYERGTARYRLGLLYLFTYEPPYTDEQIETVKNLFDLAVEDFSEVIKRDKDNYDAYISRGMVYGQMDLSFAAVADFTHVIVEDPQNDKAYYARGREYWEMERYEEAKMDYDRACELNPEWLEYFYK
ncbi:MAG: tetratricopeptide repeat protein [Deltaproteobacteria bacterium]|nr:tetratricopeptide repeat protein [Candidatus Zymogenaceae bacterium]